MKHFQKPFPAVAVFTAAAIHLLFPVIARSDSSDELRQEVQFLRKQVELLQKKVDSLEGGTKAAPTKTEAAPAPSLTPAAQEQLSREVTEKVLDKIQPNLKAASATFPSQFNPAIGLILDNAFVAKEGGQDNFEFRAAELGISANIDPFARGWAIITGSSDEFEVEEAAIATTSLPYNLKVTGGRFFADFGRLSKFHDHDLPFVNRPQALDRFVGGESQADGVELNYLLPVSEYVSLTAGAYNKLGGENDRADNGEERSFSKFTYLGRAATFLNVGDATSFDLGASFAYTPEVAIEDDSSRSLGGVDLTFRYTPLDQASYHGLIWGTEWLLNHEKRPEGGFPEESRIVRALDEPLVFHSEDANGVYSYIEAKLSRQLSPGFLFDYAEDLDGIQGATYTYSPYVTWWLSEFQRLRAEYSYVDEDNAHDNHRRSPLERANSAIIS